MTKTVIKMALEGVEPPAPRLKYLGEVMEGLEDVKSSLELKGVTVKSTTRFGKHTKNNSNEFSPSESVE